VSRANNDSATDSGTDGEADPQKLALWQGQYIFTLEQPPARPAVGWFAGKGRKGEDADFMLSLRDRNKDIRGRHARFSFNKETRFLCVARASPAVAELYVDGYPVISTVALNRSHARIRMGSLEYSFEYTDYSRRPAYSEAQKVFLKSIFGWETPEGPIMTPTPVPHAISFGEWTVSNSLGKGGSGKVSVATNTNNEIVAIKIRERNSKTESHVAHEIETLRALTLLAREFNESRIVMLRQVIFQHGTEEYKPPKFEDVSLVLEPVVKQTFKELIFATNFKLLDKLQLFRDALLGVQFLHSHYWIHTDLKPENIGIVFKDTERHVVLLDIGDAIKTSPGKLVAASPGFGGTVNYIAPERELQPYNELVDIWPMGVIGYELLYERHPWRLAKNPWRTGLEHRALIPSFHERYEKTITKLKEDPVVELASFTKLLRNMLRFPFSRLTEQVKPRPGIATVLADPCWVDLNDEKDAERPNKRVKE
jgi:serine/threonine protein kinase